MTVKGITNVVVVGAGTMGPGMAATFARHGYNTTLTDIKDEQIEKAKGTIDFVFKTLQGGGFVTEDDVAAARGKLSMTTDQAGAVANADYIVESVPERLEIKKSVFTELAEQAREDAILGSNTSGIPITTLQDGLKNPGRVIGMHWSNPPHLIPVIEVIKGAETDQATVDTTVQV
ncbi:MAG: 3-hydroxyacyl-CoA dehydrogenase family protein, partial [Thermomicrobiales bacterium]